MCCCGCTCARLNQRVSDLHQYSFAHVRVASACFHAQFSIHRTCYVLMGTYPRKSDCICLCGGSVENRCTHHLFIQIRVILEALIPGSKQKRLHAVYVLNVYLCMCVCFFLFVFLSVCLSVCLSLSGSFSLSLSLLIISLIIHV